MRRQASGQHKGERFFVGRSRVSRATSGQGIPVGPSSANIDTIQFQIDGTSTTFVDHLYNAL